MFTLLSVNYANQPNLCHYHYIHANGLFTNTSRGSEKQKEKKMNQLLTYRVLVRTQYKHVETAEIN